MGRIKALLQQKDFEGALALARQLLASRPRHVGGLSAAATATFALRRDQEALDYIRKALYIQPESAALKESLRRIQKRIDENSSSS